MQVVIFQNLKKQLAGQKRVTISMRCKNRDVVHIRKSTRPEPRQTIYIQRWEYAFILAQL